MAGVVVEADGVRRLGEDQADGMAPHGEGARQFADAVLPGKAGGEAGRYRLAKLGQNG